MIAGWDFRLAAAIAPGEAAAYDSAVANYDADDRFDADGLADWSDLTCDVLSLTAKRGSAVGAEVSVSADAGTLTGDLDDPHRLYDPVASWPTSAITLGTPLRLTATDGVATYTVWTGVAERWDYDLVSYRASVSGVDTVGRLAGVDLADLELPAEQVAERLARLLAYSPDPLTLGTDGTLGAELGPASVSGSLWQALAAVVESDGSLIWADAAGVVQWRSRGTAWGTPTDFYDCSGSVRYNTATTEVDDARLVNRVILERVTAPSRPPLTVTASDSWIVYRPHTVTATDLQLADDFQLEQLAQLWLDLRGMPRPGIAALTFDLGTELPWAHTTIAALLALEVGSAIRVHLTSRTPPRVFELGVTGIEWKLSASTAAVTLMVAPMTLEGVGRYDTASDTYDAEARYDAGRLTDSPLLVAV